MRWHRPGFDAVYLTVIIVSVFAVSLLTSSYAAHRATSATITVTQLCKTINATRARQIILWTHLMAVAPRPRHESAAGRAIRARADAAFIAYVEHVFAPADCRHPVAPVP